MFFLLHLNSFFFSNYIRNISTITSPHTQSNIMLYSDQAIKVDATSFRAPLACELGCYVVLWFLTISSFYCWPGADDWHDACRLLCIKHQVLCPCFSLLFSLPFFIIIFLSVWLTTRVSFNSWCQRVNGKYSKWINRFLVGDASSVHKGSDWWIGHGVCPSIFSNW